MRKREIVKQLKEITEDFTVDSNSSASGYYTISNHSVLLRKMHSLDRLGLFKDEIDRIRHYEVIFNNTLDKITLGPDEYKLYSSVFYNLRMKSLGVVGASCVFLTQENENSISVKLPEVDSLDELTQHIGKIERALQGTLFDDQVRSEIKLTGFDSGSMWLEICVNTAFAVSIIGSAAWAALVVKKKYYEIEKFKKDLELIDTNSEHINAVKDGLEKSLKVLISSEADHILNHYGVTDEARNESHARMVMSIKLLSELFTKGCEIHGQLNAPSDIESPFPNYNAAEMITSKIKQITSNENVS